MGLYFRPPADISVTAIGGAHPNPRNCQGAYAVRIGQRPHIMMPFDEVKREKPPRQIDVQRTAIILACLESTAGQEITKDALIEALAAPNDALKTRCMAVQHLGVDIAGLPEDVSVSYLRSQADASRTAHELFSMQNGVNGDKKLYRREEFDTLRNRLLQLGAADVSLERESTPTPA